jgi:hypothetical protein
MIVYQINGSFNPKDKKKEYLKNYYSKKQKEKREALEA